MYNTDEELRKVACSLTHYIYRNRQWKIIIPIMSKWTKIFIKEYTV